MGRADALRKLLPQKWILIPLVAASSLSACAEPVGSSEAALAAKAWCKLRFQHNRQPQLADGRRMPAITGDAARPITIEGETVAYAFDTPGGGCIVIAADDRLPPVLYYSLHHRLTVPTVPPAEAILESFAQRIAELEETPRRGDGAPYPLWSTLLKGSGTENAVRALDSFPWAAAGPLLTSTWHQREPYNLQCPRVQDEDCPVGCTALAMAQIMRYWQWPETGEESHCYHWSFGDKELCADFGSTTYDWGNMPDEASQDSPPGVRDAVSTLCYHCGVSIDSEFFPHGSSGGTLAAGLALARYFGYGYTRVVEKSNTNTEWHEVMHDQIAKGQPVLCTILWADLPHTVVLDGHDDPNFVHLNMGWGGPGDGWYAIVDLPEVCVIDIRPHKQPMTFYANADVGDDGWDGTAAAWDGGAHGPKKSLRAAVDALSGPRDAVVVADGIYTGEGNRGLVFGAGRLIGNTPLTVQSSGGPANCVIDCQGAGRAFSFYDGVGERVRIAGFTIREGQGGFFGGAIYCSSSGPTITNCLIYGNAAEWGGAVYSTGMPGPTITSSIIAGNSATHGGAIGCDGTSAPTIINCVIHRNVAAASGGGLFACDGPIRNCIIRGNTAPDGVQLYDSAEPAYSCIESWTDGGEGNIDRDPRFVDADGPDDDVDTYDDNNYRLSWDSPCIDAGDNSALDPPGLDLDRNLRIALGKLSLTVDMGAYEYGSPRFAVRQIILSDGGGLQLIWNSQPNDTYAIFSCVDLLAGQWNEEASAVPSAGGMTSWINHGLSGTGEFYRIGIR